MPPRKRTLEAVLDWSYDALNPDERRILHRLAVFSGGWTEDDAAVVGGDDAPVVLGRLVRRSMIVDERGAPRRFRMLEPIRAHAAKRLANA